ncbi:Hypothetical protein CINCED_3A016749 [Cinara cedri]|uniref:Uncharacterized protein n=1 Tax=Cinara cedri TaxID=506608 RepID=A0A5E4M9Q8_9HEMI|nr:Hypothetical protein CINCED_3A016749 [Cinara cedri]
MNSDKIQTQLMPKEWVKWKPSILKNDGKLYKIEYIVEEKDEKKIEIEEVTKIEETDASFKIYFSVNQKNILNSGGSIIIKKGTFPVNAKVTQINACSDGSTENLENKSIHRAKSTKKLHSEPNSDYKRKLRSNSTKFPQNEQITKEPEPKLQIVNNQNIPAQRLGDEITKNIPGNISGAQEVSVEDHREETAIKVAKPYRIKTRSFGIENRKMMSSDNIQTQLMPKEWGDEITKNILGNISGAQEVSVEDHREETAIKISNLLNSGFSSISNKDKKKIIKLLNLCEPTDEIFNNSNIVSPELVYFILNGESTSLEKETSTANLCEPTNQIVNNLNVSSQELVNEPNSIIEQMDNEGIEEKEKITEDITTETDVMIIVENDPIDPNKPRKWKQEITTICKITTITNIKEIHT